MILQDDILNIPNVITPNGDGINDVFYIENIDKYPNSVLTILNRWEILYLKLTVIAILGI